MLWVLLWVVLVVGAAVVIGLIAVSVVRKGVATGKEVSAVAADLATVQDQLSRLEDAQPEPAAVFTDPATLRADQAAVRRAARRGGSAR